MSSLKLLRNFQKQAEKAGKKQKKPAVCGNLRKESEKSGRSRIRDQKAAGSNPATSTPGSVDFPTLPGFPFLAELPVFSG